MKGMNAKLRRIVELKAIDKMNKLTGSFGGDSLEFRIGYISCLCDLGVLDGLAAARMMLEQYERFRR